MDFGLSSIVQVQDIWTLFDMFVVNDLKPVLLKWSKQRIQN